MTWKDVYEAAGIVGVNPDLYTLEELFWMCDGQQRLEWTIHSQLCSVIYNSIPSIGKRPKPHRNATHFNPYEQQKKVEVISWDKMLDAMCGPRSDHV